MFVSTAATTNPASVYVEKQNTINHFSSFQYSPSPALLPIPECFAEPPGELKLMLNLFNLGFDFQPNQLKLKFDLRSLANTHTHTLSAGIWEKKSLGERKKNRKLLLIS